MMATASPDASPDTDFPPTPNFSLNRVGSLFLEQASPSNDDSTYYVLGSIGRLCNEVDDITLAETNRSRTPSSSSPKVKAVTQVPTGFNRDTPVFSWESRIADSRTTGVNDGSSLDAMAHQRQKAGSSLAPQSSSDPSDDDKSEAPSVGQFRPGTDLIQCPVPGCGRNFKWKKNLHHHIRDKHPTDAHGMSVLRVQPSHPGAAHGGFRLQSIAIAPPQNGTQTLPGDDPSLRCPECGKVFARKGDLVHHKRYHTRSTDRPYKCPQCGQGFIHYKDLSRHMPRHTGQRSFQCPYSDCHKNYTRKDNLNRHMRHDHGGLDVYGEVWTGVEQSQQQPQPIPMSLQQSPQDQQQHSPPLDSQPATDMVPIDPLVVDPAIHTPVVLQTQPLPLESLTAIAEAAQNQPILREARSESSISEGSGPALDLYGAYRETTPSLGKRPADDADRLSTFPRPKRRPKEKWAHRLGCPFRKCRGDAFTTEHGYRVCETTPHEFIIRLIEHMKRNHELFVCGECYAGFVSPDALGDHKANSHHCPKCYVSLATEQEFIDHFGKNRCTQVEAATQEDIWQILYETLCNDGVRHNPSFDDDSAIPQSYESSNQARMDFLARQALAPGQVPPLARQIEASSISDDRTAPSIAPTEKDYPQLVSKSLNTSIHLTTAAQSVHTSPNSGSSHHLVDNEAGLAPLGTIPGVVAVKHGGQLVTGVSTLCGYLQDDQLSSARVLENVESIVRSTKPSFSRFQSSTIKVSSKVNWAYAVAIDEALEGGPVMVTTRMQEPSQSYLEEAAMHPIRRAVISSAELTTVVPPVSQCPSLVAGSEINNEDEWILHTPRESLSISVSPTVDATQPALWWGQMNEVWECQKCGCKVREHCILCDACTATI